jgi:hypothetical protein
MPNTPMTPDQEFDFYEQPENQEPQGPARRRHASRLGTPVPVRFPPELLEPDRLTRYAHTQSSAVSKPGTAVETRAAPEAGRH